MRPAVGLFFIAPLVAEFLLGNLPITMLPAMAILAPMYGGGALLIREAVRRTGRGWPSIFVLALAYGVVEEAFVTQTLFNPDYLGLGLRLLEPAPIPALGLGGWWTVFVLTQHTVWSVATSIALAESLVPDRTTTAWLGTIGLVVAAALFALGVVATTLITLKDDPFIASPFQFAAAALVCVVLILVAFRMPVGLTGAAPGSLTPPRLVGAGALVVGSAFLLIPKEWGWLAVGAYLLLDFLTIATVAHWVRRSGWDGRHELALAGGATLAYAWHAFPQVPVVGADGVVDLAGNAVFALGAVALLVIAARRTTAARGRALGR